jgi:hypothetical protein
MRLRDDPACVLPQPAITVSTAVCTSTGTPAALPARG